MFDLTIQCVIHASGIPIDLNSVSRVFNCFILLTNRWRKRVPHVKLALESTPKFLREIVLWAVSHLQPLLAVAVASEIAFLLEFDNETSTPRKQRLAAFICACLKRHPKGASYYARRLRLRAHPQIRPTTASPHCESAATHHPRRLPPRPLRLARLP